MVDDEVLAAIERRLSRVLASPSRSLTRFEVDGAVAGHITPERVERLRRFRDVFRIDDAVRFAPELRSVAERTAALEPVTTQLAREGALTAWRDEPYAVAPAFGESPWFVIERAAARYFGVHTYAAHVNGLVREGDAILMWLARRSATKSIDPGMLDNLIGGGIAADATTAHTVIKEAWEEAGIPAAVASTAKPHGSVTIFREQPDGIQHETMFVHDLWLAPDFAPANQDGEAVDHRRVPLHDAARLIAVESGPDTVTADASLVILDCLVRHGAVTNVEARDRLSTIYKTRA
jgi:8-oxo-dGTP pyrophosphatase MutT (NUDIX family)